MPPVLITRHLIPLTVAAALLGGCSLLIDPPETTSAPSLDVAPDAGDTSDDAAGDDDAGDVEDAGGDTAGDAADAAVAVEGRCYEEVTCGTEVDPCIVEDVECECRGDVECVPPDANATILYTCVEGVCHAAAIGAGEPCDDGIACTNEDTVTVDGVCEGNREHDDCDDADPCTRDRCLDICTHTPIVVEDSDPCFQARCEACAAGDDGCAEGFRIVREPVACSCEDVAECDAPCREATCEDNRCAYTVLTNGTPCDLGCEGDVAPVCIDGVCVPPVEALGLGDTCKDDLDNDCDDLEDDDDPDCLSADTLTLFAPTTGPAGLEEPGVSLTLAADSLGQPLIGHETHLYCQGRRLVHTVLPGNLYENYLDDPGTPSSFIPTGLESEDASLDIAGYSNSALLTGLKVCSGAGFIYDSVPFPVLGDEPAGLMINIRMGNDRVTPLGAGNMMIVSYAHDGTDGYVPAIILGDNQDRYLKPYTFIVFSESSENTLRLRVDTARANTGDLQRNDCGFVRSVQFFAVPHLDPDRPRPPGLTWSVEGEGVQEATRDFDEDDAATAESFFADRDLDQNRVYVFTPEASAATGGAQGLGYFAARASLNQARVGRMTFPRLIRPARHDRSLPILFELNMRLVESEWNQDERVELQFGGLGSSRVSFVTLASAVGTNMLQTLDDYAFPYQAAHRYTVVLPEEAKTFDDVEVRLESRSLDDFGGGERVEIDQVRVGAEAAFATDIVVGKAEARGGGYVVDVRAAHPGEVLVQCFWQVYGDSSHDTIGSNTHLITFE